MKKCIDCAFLSKVFANINDGRIHTFTLTSEDKKEILENKWFKKNNPYNLECYKKIWAQGTGISNENLIKIIKDTDRSKNCFFLPAQDDLMFTGAEKLQEQKARNLELKQQLKWTIIGLIISGSSMLLTFVLDLVKFLMGK